MHRTIQLEHGCRSEYGPLELRLQSTTSVSGFVVFIEDSRLNHRLVHEHPIQSTLGAAKEYAVTQARQYLDRLSEAAEQHAVWRCS